MISKRIRQRQNQAFAAPLVTPTRLSIQEVVSAVRDLCTQHNAAITADLERTRQQGNRFSRWAASNATGADRMLYASLREKDVLVGFQNKPEILLASTRRPGFFDGYWVASVAFPPDPPDLEPGMQLVEVSLLSWVTDSEGRLNCREKYEQLTDGLWNALSVRATA